MRASVDTDRQVLLDRAAALRAFLRGVPRVDDGESATGPFSLVAQHRGHHARRNLEDLLVERGLLPDVFAWTFDVPSAEVVNIFTLRSSTAMPPKRAAIAAVS